MPESKHIIRHVKEADWPHLKPLWLTFYEHQKEHGMLLDLPPDAYDLWVSSLLPVLGRYGFIFVAEEGDTLFGFLTGRVRSQPSYYGGQPTGFLSELFIADSHRHRGIGDKLMAASARWFAERAIKRVEFQVLVNNLHALEYFRQRGWTEELIQMVWQAK